MAGRVITLFLEDTHIRLLVASGNRVEQWASSPLEPGLVSGGVIQDQDRVADKLKELFLTAKPKRGKIMVGLSGIDSLYRLISLPELPAALLPEAIRREAARVLPVSLDELYLSYQVMSGSSGEKLYFVAVFPRSTTDILIKTLRKAGVMPAVVELTPLALCRIVNEPRSIIVGIRLDHLNIIVMANRVPQVIRTLILQNEAKTLSEKLPSITEELSRTVAFYNTSHPQEPLDSKVPVLVLGDLADSPDVWKALVGELDNPVSALRTSMEYPADFPLIDFMVNIGLASRELPPEKGTAYFSLVNFNALPQAYLPERPKPVRIIIPSVAAVGIVVLFLMWFNLQNNTASNALLNSQLQSINDRIGQSAKDIAALTQQNRTIQSQIQPFAGLRDTLKAKFDSLETAQAQTDDDLQKIKYLKPATVILLTVALSDSSEGGRQINVNGSAPRDEILNYAGLLRDTGGFSVIVSSLQYVSTLTDTGGKTEWYEFQFQVNSLISGRMLADTNNKGG